MTRSTGKGERGSGTALVSAAMLLAALLAAAILVVAGFLASVHHARAAADLVALSGAAQHAAGGNACQGAARIAAANSVRLSGCKVSGDSLDFVVSVTVARRVAAPAAVLPGEVAATAHAGRIGLLP